MSISSSPNRTVDRIALFIAQGFGVGLIPFAPGTFGTLLGFGWFFLLLAFGDAMIFLAGSLSGIAISVWCASRAERILGKVDPGSVVIDEIIAIPFCFLGLILAHRHTAKYFHPAHFQQRLGLLLIVFIAFRFFDILKPWPIHRSQKLGSGWGITIDDLLAAGYVNLLWLTPFAP